MCVCVRERDGRRRPGHVECIRSGYRESTFALTSSSSGYSTRRGARGYAPQMQAHYIAMRYRAAFISPR